MTDIPQQTANCAGAIVLTESIGNAHIGMALGSEERDGKTIWGLPKGHIELGETAIDAALRETEEECGLFNVTVLCYLGVIVRPALEKSGESVLKTINMFLAWSQMGDEGSKDCGWFYPGEAVKRLHFPQDQEFVRKHLGPLIRFQEDKNK